MNQTELAIPADFVPITVVFPNADQRTLLGYAGSARFVGFYWDIDFGGVVWNDGRQTAFGRSENFTFSRFIRPLAFLYNVNFGTRGGKATHLLVWDRDQAAAYLAPRESAIRFLGEQQASGPGEASSEIPATRLSWAL